MIHSVLQWQMKRKPPPALSNTGASPGETKIEAEAETGSPSKAEIDCGALSDEIRIESEALPSEAGAKARAPPSKATAKTGAPISDHLLPFCDDDAGEGPSSLIREKPVPKQEEDKEEKPDEEQTGKLKRELGGKTATCTRPERPLLGLVLTPTRELAVQVKQHIDAVAKFTGEVWFHFINISREDPKCWWQR